DWSRDVRSSDLQGATLTPSEPGGLALTTTYTATITGGSSGVKDVAGNALAANFTWSFTTGSGGSGCPCTIWSASATPAVIAASDPILRERGVNFPHNQSST